MRIKLIILAMLSGLLLNACSNGSESGPKEAKWGRDTCERCRMVLSDRNYSAQIRYLPEGKSFTQVIWFDDIGCAAMWLEDKPWKDDPRTEIWVADHRNGSWIDARKASYVKGKTTPMDYGLGAQSDSVAGGLNFTQAKAHIQQMEKQHNQR